MKRDFTIGAAWSTAASFLEQGAGALIFLIIARLVGVEGFGVAAMALAFLFLGEFLVRDTLTEAIVERDTLEDGRLEATFVLLVGLSLAIVAALVLISQVAAKAYGEPDVAPLLLAASPTVLMIGLAGVPTALLRRKLAYRTLALRSVVGVVLGGVVGVVMALNDFGAFSLVGQRLTEMAVNSVIVFAAADWRPKRWPRRAEFALVRGLGPRVVLLRAVTLVIAQTPTVALGLFADPRAAGIFALAWRVAELANALVVKPMKGVAQSAIAAMRRRRASTPQFYLDLNEVAALGAFAAFAGLALVADPMVELLLGAGWRDAGAILPLLCVAGAVSALTALQEAYLLAIGRLDRLLKVSLVEALVGVALVAVASRYGAGMAALAVAVRTLAVFPLRTYAALSHEGIGPAQFARSLVSPILVTAGMAVAVGLWSAVAAHRVPDLLYVAVAIVIGVVAFCGILFAAQPGTVVRLRAFLDHRDDFAA